MPRSTAQCKSITQPWSFHAAALRRNGRFQDGVPNHVSAAAKSTRQLNPDPLSGDILCKSPAKATLLVPRSQVRILPGALGKALQRACWAAESGSQTGHAASAEGQRLALAITGPRYVEPRTPGDRLSRPGPVSTDRPPPRPLKVGQGCADRFLRPRIRARVPGR